MEFYSIGVYNSTKEEFFNKLRNQGIDTFCDIRQRRGVRGAKYSFVNSLRLQNTLSELNINYLHVSELAPTTEIRDLQNEADNRLGEKKRNREKLGKVFSIAYKSRILNNFSFEDFLIQLSEIKASRIVLFCVEENPDACHRSLVTEKLRKMGYEITHL